MTRKDYVLIAAAIMQADNRVSGDVARDVLSIVVNELADALAADNPRFDRDRFLKACGVRS